MYNHKHSTPVDKDIGSSLVAVAINKSKGSQYALKWAIDNLLARGQTVILVHVKITNNPSEYFKLTRAFLKISKPFILLFFSPFKSCIALDEEGIYKEPMDHHMKEIFLPFRCFCTRKDVIYFLNPHFFLIIIQFSKASMQKLKRFGDENVSKKYYCCINIII